MVYGFMSGLGAVIAIKLTKDPTRTMYLVKNMETNEEVWHLERGIDKMKKMYDDWIAGKPVGIMFENYLKDKI